MTSERLRQDLPWIEPIEAYQALRQFKPSLLDGMGAHPEARFAYLALSPAYELRCVDGTWQRHDPTGGVQTIPGPVLETLQALLDAEKRNVPEPEGFTGGFVGYFGYEFTRFIEPTLQMKAASTPDAVLRFCPDAVVFDRGEKKCWAYVMDEHEPAATRLDHYVAAWHATNMPALGQMPPWSPAMDQVTFEAAVKKLRERIENGDLFQANIATRFDAPLSADPVALFATFAKYNPSPYMALLEFHDHALVSSSPEQLLAVQNGVVRTRPIAGTRPRGATDLLDGENEQQLRTDEKEQAEHTMLVDLLRNDVAKISVPGTTQVAEAMSVERYQKVMHLVSRVEGQLLAGTKFVDWLAALFPGGTITGAPKHRACMRIEESEPVARGPYTGSAGYISFSHNVHLNILIRTLLLQDGQGHVHAGSGIVADSDPAGEWLEAGSKAASLLAPGGGASRLGEVTRHGNWQPPMAPTQVTARVLLVDNYDSFVHNLADYCRTLGAEVRVVRNHMPLEESMVGDPTHIILGPGPGWPGESGLTLQLAKQLDLPTLGICLGHQAMAQAHGGAVHVAPAVHGKTSPIHHDGKGLFTDLPTPFVATRYHSLVVHAPPGWHVAATLADGTVMAMRHPNKPAWGLQFHPESFCTEGGLEMLGRFLNE